MSENVASKVVPISDVESPVVQPRADSGVAEVMDAEPTAPEGETVVADNEPQAPEVSESKNDGEEIEEVIDEEVEIIDDDDLGVDHHEQPTATVADVEEILDDEDEETIESNDEENEDKEREDALEQMRNTCDSAHPSLNVKMPHISKRETKRSVVSKFIARNRSFVSPKYANMRIDSMNSLLADEILKDTISNIEAKSNALQVKKTSGFVPSRYGAVDKNF